MTRPIPLAAVELVKRFEGCRLKPYRCPAGLWTVGYGHVLSPDKDCDGEGFEEITEEEAEGLLRVDMRGAADSVERLVKVVLADDQFGALVCFVFNVGAGAFKSSTLLRMLNAGNFDEAPGQFARWTKANGVVLPGLVRRRAAEAALFSGH